MKRLLIILFLISTLKAQNEIIEHTDEGVKFHINDTIYGPYEPPPFLTVRASEYPLQDALIRGKNFIFNYYKNTKAFVNANGEVFGPFGIVYCIALSDDGSSFGFVYSEEGKLFKEFYVRINDKVFGPYDDAWKPSFSKDGKYFGFRYRIKDKEYVMVNNKIFGPYVPLGKNHNPPAGEAFIYLGDRRLDIGNYYLGLFYDNDKISPMGEVPPMDPLLNDALPVFFSEDGSKFAFSYRRTDRYEEIPFIDNIKVKACPGDFFVKTGDTLYGPFRVAVPLWLKGNNLLIIEENCPEHCCDYYKREFKIHLNGIFIKNLLGAREFYITQSLSAIISKYDIKTENWLKNRLVLKINGGILIDWIYLPYSKLEPLKNSDEVLAFLSGDKKGEILNYEKYIKEGRIFFDFKIMSKDDRIKIIRNFANRENISIPDLRGWTMLHWAVWDGNLEIVKYLFEFGAELTKTVKKATSVPYEYNEYIREYFSPSGADSLWPMEESNKKFYRWSIFNIAAYKGHKKVLGFLVKKAIEQKLFDFKAFDGKTLLHFASFAGDTALIKTIISKGSDINIKDKYGLTPLHLACFGNNSEAVSFLLKNGADRNVKDKKGRIPCDLAKSEKIRKLLECK